MKNVYTKMMALACMFLLGTNAWADTHTISWADQSMGYTADTYVTTTSGSIEGIVSFTTENATRDADVQNQQNNCGLHLLTFNGKPGSITLTPAWGVTISEVVVTSYNDHPNLIWTPEGGTSHTITMAESHNKPYNYTISGLSIAANQAHSLKITASNMHVQTIKLTYTKQSWTNTTTTIDATGITNTDVNAGLNAGSLSATVTPGNGSVTWKSSNTAVATIDANTGAVALHQAGNVTFTATYAGEWGQYNPSKATYTMTVTDSTPEPGRWEKVAISELTSDDVFVIVGTTSGGGSYALANDDGKGNNPKAVAVTLTADGKTISSKVADNIKWNLGSESGNDTYYFNPNGKSTYLYYNTKTNPALRVGDAVTNYTPYKDFGYSNGHLTFKNHFTKTQYIHISGSPLRWKLNTTQDDQVSVSFYKLVLDEEPVSAYISSVGYGTMYYGEVNLEVPAGVEAYTYVINNDGKLEVNTTYTEGNQIPAGEAVVIKGSAGNYSFAVKAPTSNRDASNVLKGTDHKAMTEGGYSYYYALSLNANNDPNSVGFYWMKSNGEAFENGAHKAYLALDQTFAELAGTTVKAFVLPQEDDATGINEVLNQETQEVIYNLAGQRLQKMQKGINIVNGKKILF